MSTPIIVLAGQSNAARAGTRLGVADVASQSGAYYIPFAVSGTPLAEEIDGNQGDWSASGAPGAGEHLIRLYALLDNVLNPSSPNYIPDAYLAGVVWIQGEADSFYEQSVNDYVGNLVELRDAVVARYGAHEWVISALSEVSWEGRVGPTKVYDRFMQLRDNQLGMATIDGFTVVDPDQVARALGVSSADMFDPDRVHYPEAFGRTLGAALAEKLMIQTGDVRLQVGTADRDEFFVVGEFRHEVFGSTGLNSVDFSAIGKGLYFDDHGERFVSARYMDRSGGFSAELVEIGRVFGTNFADEFYLGTSLRDIRAGGGNDRVYAGPISINVQMGDGDDRVYGSEFDDNIIGQNGRDALYGYGGSDRIFGGNDNDRLYGGAGDDLLDGSQGNDQFDGGTGADVMSGGTGNDRYYVDNAGDLITESASSGEDQINSSVSYILPTNVERLLLVANAGDINAIGNASNNRLYGNAGTNLLDGQSGNDLLYGGGGNDILLGGAGQDRLYGGGGADILEGGLGNDTYYVDQSGDVVREVANGGHDFVDSTVSYTLSDNIERLRLAKNAGDINGVGNAMDNRVYGSNGSNILHGMDGDDMLYGNAGNDTLYGGNGNDRMYGGDGDDVIYSGAGVDRMHGGAGRDTFIFGSAVGTQMIEDFRQGTDIVKLAGVDFDDLSYTSRGNGIQITFAEDQVIYFSNVGHMIPTQDDFIFV